MTNGEEESGTLPVLRWVAVPVPWFTAKEEAAIRQDSYAYTLCGAYAYLEFRLTRNKYRGRIRFNPDTGATEVQVSDDRERLVSSLGFDLYP